MLFVKLAVIVSSLLAPECRGGGGALLPDPGHRKQAPGQPDREGAAGL